METFAWFGLCMPLKPQIGCNSNYRKKFNQDSNLTYIQVSGKDCFTKVVSNNDTDIWTPSPGVRMTLLPQRIHHQRWRTGAGKMTISAKDCLIKHVPNDDANFWAPSAVVRMPPRPPRIHHQRWRIGVVLAGKMTISDKDCFTKDVPNDDTDF